MKATPPRSLKFNGKAINFAGTGRAPGALAYVDPSRGTVVEVYFAKVISVSPTHCLAGVANNQALPPVRISYRDLNGLGVPYVGQVVLVGPLTFQASGPRARAIWRAQTQQSQGSHNGNGSPTRVGVVTVLKASHWGFVTPLGGGRQALVHRNHCTPGMALSLGLRVRYREQDREPGPLAVNVRYA